MSEMVPSVAPAGVVVSQAPVRVPVWVREFASLFAAPSQEVESREEV